MSTPNIKSMDVTQLLALRGDIDRALQSKRSELQAQLAQIGSGGGESTGRKAGALKGKKVEAKYRHPKTGETWSGRGGVASWLAKEIKAGKKREEFLIDKAGKKAAR